MIQTLKQKLLLRRTYKRLKSLWDEYERLTHLRDKEAAVSKLREFLDAFLTSYSMFEQTQGVELERIYDESSEVILHILDFIEKNEVSSESGQDEVVLSELSELVTKSVAILEIILRDDRYKDVVKETPELFTRIIDLLDKLPDPESKKYALRMLTSLGGSEEGQIELCRLDRLNKILSMTQVETDDEGLRREVLRTIRKLVDSSEGIRAAHVLHEKSMEKEVESEDEEGLSTHEKMDVAHDDDGEGDAMDLSAGGGDGDRDTMVPTTSNPSGKESEAEDPESLASARSRILRVFSDIVGVISRVNDIFPSIASPIVSPISSPPTARSIGSEGSEERYDASGSSDMSHRLSSPGQEVPEILLLGPPATGDSAKKTQNPFFPPSEKTLLEEMELYDGVKGTKAPQMSSVEEATLKEMVGIQGGLLVLTETIRKAAHEVNVDVVRTIGKLLFGNVRNQEEMRRITGYSFFLRLFEMSDEYSTENGEVFLHECFGLIREIALDGRTDKRIGNPDMLPTLFEIMTRSSHDEVRLYALRCLRDIVGENFLNVVALHRYRGIDALFDCLQDVYRQDSPNTSQLEIAELASRMLLYSSYVLAPIDASIIEGFSRFVAEEELAYPFLRSCLSSIVVMAADLFSRQLPIPKIVSAHMARFLFSQAGKISPPASPGRKDREREESCDEVFQMEMTETGKVDEETEDEEEDSVGRRRTGSDLNGIPLVDSLGDQDASTDILDDDSNIILLGMDAISIICQETACLNHFRDVCGFDSLRALVSVRAHPKVLERVLSSFVDLALDENSNDIIMCLLSVLKRPNPTKLRVPILRTLRDLLRVSKNIFCDRTLAARQFVSQSGIEMTIEILRDGTFEEASAAILTIGESFVGCEDVKKIILERYGIPGVLMLVKGIGFPIQKCHADLFFEMACHGSVMEASMAPEAIGVKKFSYEPPFELPFTPSIEMSETLFSSSPTDAIASPSTKENIASEKYEQLRKINFGIPVNIGAVHFVPHSLKSFQEDIADSSDVSLLMHRRERLQMNRAGVTFRSKESARSLLNFILTLKSVSGKIECLRDFLVLCSLHKDNVYCLAQDDVIEMLLNLAHQSNGELRSVLMGILRLIGQYNCSVHFLKLILSGIESCAVSDQWRSSLFVLLEDLARRDAPRACMTFSGVSPAVHVGSLNCFPQSRNGLTVSFWVCIGKLPAARTSLVSVLDDSYTLLEIGIVRPRSASSSFGCIYVSMPTVRGKDSSPTTTTFSDCILVEDDAWHHVVVSLGKTSAAAFLDLHAKEVINVSLLPKPSSSKDKKFLVHLGGSSSWEEFVVRPPNTSDSFCGNLGSVGIFDGLASPDIVTSLHEVQLLSPDHLKDKGFGSFKPLLLLPFQFEGIWKREGGGLTSLSPSSENDKLLDTITLADGSASQEAPVNQSSTVRRATTMRRQHPRVFGIALNDSEDISCRLLSDISKESGFLHVTCPVWDTVMESREIDRFFDFLRGTTFEQLICLRTIITMFSKSQKVRGYFFDVGGFCLIGRILVENSDGVSSESVDVLVDMIYNMKIEDSKAGDGLHCILDVIRSSSEGIQVSAYRELLDVFSMSPDKLMIWKTTGPGLVGLLDHFTTNTDPQVASSLRLLLKTFFRENAKEDIDTLISYLSLHEDQSQTALLDECRFLEDLIVSDDSFRTVFLSSGGINLVLSFLDVVEEPVRVASLSLLLAILRTDEPSLNAFVKNKGFEYVLEKLKKYVPTTLTFDAIMEWSFQSTSTTQFRSRTPKKDEKEPDSSVVQVGPLSILFGVLQNASEDISLQIEVAIAVEKLLDDRNLGILLQENWLDSCWKDFVCSVDEESPLFAAVRGVTRKLLLFDLQRPTKQSRISQIRDFVEAPKFMKIVLLDLCDAVAENLSNLAESSSPFVRNLSCLLDGLESAIEVPLEVYLGFIDLINSLVYAGTPDMRNRVKQHGLLGHRDSFIRRFLMLHFSPQRNVDILVKFPFESVVEQASFRDPKSGGLTILVKLYLDASLSDDYEFSVVLSRILKEEFFTIPDNVSCVEEMMKGKVILSPQLIEMDVDEFRSWLMSAEQKEVRERVETELTAPAKLAVSRINERHRQKREKKMAARLEDINSRTKQTMKLLQDMEEKRRTQMNGWMEEGSKMQDAYCQARDIRLGHRQSCESERTSSTLDQPHEEGEPVVKMHVGDKSLMIDVPDRLDEQQNDDDCDA
eukprot:TRINITY_DN1903_c0_g1_i1.p1 TRINITY_DN1903_c0_g1~~TRINITY_DN1903_c0_g1_i1.p1  ORF type:complete len:2202 (+),score=582.27 TRINITY_DN1903_c0_g1_i1:364-6969(+)